MASARVRIMATRFVPLLAGSSRAVASERVPAAAPAADANVNLIRQEFKKQAALYAPHPKPMQFVMSEVGAVSGTALDVASGTGAFAMALAPLCEKVVSFDATKEMQERARKTAAEQGHRNIEFEQGDASDLPYPDGTFDLVVSRLAIHHFAAPGPIVDEMARVCRPGGRVVVADMLGDDDAAQRAETNRLEILRDPSHTANPTLAGLHGLLEATGRLRVLRHSGKIYEHPVPAHWWMDNTETPPEAREEIERSLLAELAGGKRTGMRPFMDSNGTLTFFHRYCVAQGVRMA